MRLVLAIWVTAFAASFGTSFVAAETFTLRYRFEASLKVATGFALTLLVVLQVWSWALAGAA